MIYISRREIYFVSPHSVFSPRGKKPVVKNMHSILISNLNNLGDVICGTAGLALLRRNFPQAKIGLMIRPDAEGVMRGHPLVDDLFVYRYKSGSSLSSIREMAQRIRPHNYEAYLSLDRKPRSVAVAALAGIRNRITPDRLHLTTRPKWWMPLAFKKIIRYPQNHFRCLVEQFADPVRKAFGIEGEAHTSLPPRTPEQKAKAAHLLAPGQGKKIIGFSVKANAAVKDWPSARFAELMDRLAEKYDAFEYITGAPGDREYIDALIALCRKAKPQNFAGQTSLMDTVALADESDLFVTLDTGAVHLAGNSDLRNLICIFTATIPEGVLRSARQAHVFWSAEPCCPCLSCPHPYGAMPCQTNITVDEVFAKAVDLLDKDAVSA